MLTDVFMLSLALMGGVGYIAAGHLFYLWLLCDGKDEAEAKKMAWGVFITGAFIWPVGALAALASLSKLQTCREKWGGPLARVAAERDERAERKPRRKKREGKSRADLPPVDGKDVSFWSQRVRVPKLKDWSGTRELEFTYRNSKGEQRDRRVSMKKVYTDGGVNYLVGFCHIRGALRTFRADRVKGKVVDMETGEIGKLTDLFEVK